MAKKGKNAIKALSGSAALLSFGNGRKHVDVVVTNAGGEETIFKLRSLSNKEIVECRTFAHGIKPDSPFAGLGEFMIYLTKMLLNEDKTQMFDSFEEGLVIFQAVDAMIFSALIPTITDLISGEGRVLKPGESLEDLLEEKIEEAAKN